MRKKERQEIGYYKIRKSHLRIGIVVVLCIMGVIWFKQDLYKMWQQKQGRVDVTYEGIESALKSKEECYLCGSNSESLMGHYRKFHTIGIISINDWYVLDCGVGNYEENEDAWDNKNAGLSTDVITTEEVFIMMSRMPDRGRATINISLPEDYKPDIEMLQEHLCQECLDKVTKSLEISKWKYEKKQAIPLCLVDFQTLEIYSLQDWHRGCSIRDYWVEMEFEGNDVEVEVFYLPRRE